MRTYATLYVQDDGIEVVFEIKNKKLNRVLCGDPYHDKISERIDEFFHTLDYLKIKYKRIDLNYKEILRQAKQNTDFDSLLFEDLDMGLISKAANFRSWASKTSYNVKWDFTIGVEVLTETLEEDITMEELHDLSVDKINMIQHLLLGMEEDVWTCEVGEMVFAETSEGERMVWSI